MKNFIILLLFISSFCLFSCSHKKNDWAKEHLKGNVKSIVETYHQTIDSTRNTKIFYLYNEAGNLVETKVYSNDSLLLKTAFIYNNKNKLVQKNTYNADTLQQQTNYNFGDNGDMISSMDYNIQYHTAVKYEYVYDKNNNISEIDGWNLKDTLKKTNTLKSNYKYDDKDNLVEEKHFNINSELAEKRASVYDDKGNLISIEIDGQAYNPNDQKFTYNYDFDQTGNWITQRIFKNDTLLEIKKRVIEYY